jgi:hypothetical protein
MSNNPLVNLGDLSRPATVLIEKISDAVGGVFKPFQIVRVARAEAEAEVIQAKAQIQVSDLQRRAMHRFLVEEAKRQSNIESITRTALPLLDEKASPQDVEDDWIANFFEKSRIISDEQMQKLWSGVLAGEANSPGAFSKRTVNLLADLDKRDAELFTRLCGFVWMIGDFAPLVFDVQSEIYGREGMDFNSLTHLDTLGLIKFDTVAGFIRLGLPKKATVSYYGVPVELTLPNEQNNQIECGKVLLTNAGKELAPICDAKPLDGFFDFVCERWARQSFIPKKEPAPSPTI